MREGHRSEPLWHRSSRSIPGENANCVEVAFLDSAVAVRDSKDPDGAALVVAPHCWAAFLRCLGA